MNFHLNSHALLGYGRWHEVTVKSRREPVPSEEPASTRCIELAVQSVASCGRSWMHLRTGRRSTPPGKRAEMGSAVGRVGPGRDDAGEFS